MNLRMFFMPMTTHTVPTKLRIATLLLVGALAVQPTAAALAKPPLQLAQLATAVLTLPASAATVAYPDAKGLTLLDAALRATNEILAAYRQESYYSAGWACIDAVQTIRALAALTAKQIPLQQNPDTIEWDDETTIATDNESDAPTPEKPTTQWASFKRTAEYVLITAEAAARIWAASLSNEHTTQAHDKLWWHTSEELHGLTSLIRLTRHCLHTEKNSYKALTLVLMTANAVALYFQHTRYYQPAAQQYQTELKRSDNTTKPANNTKTPVNITPTPVPTNTIPTASVRNGISLGDNINIRRPKTDDIDACPICLNDLNKRADDVKQANLTRGEDTTIRTLDCNHQFHAYCIHAYILSESTDPKRKAAGASKDQTECPICRRPIEGTHNIVRRENIPLNLYENQRDGIADNVV